MRRLVDVIEESVGPSRHPIQDVWLQEPCSGLDGRDSATSRTGVQTRSAAYDVGLTGCLRVGQMLNLSRGSNLCPKDKASEETSGRATGCPTRAVRGYYVVRAVSGMILDRRLGGYFSHFIDLSPNGL